MKKTREKEKTVQKETKETKETTDELDEFIRKKRIQNKVLKEMIEKIKVSK